MSERLRLDIDTESYARLREIAAAQRRPIGWQAEWMLIQAITEYWSPGSYPKSPETEAASAAKIGL